MSILSNRKKNKKCPRRGPLYHDFKNRENSVWREQSV